MYLDELLSFGNANNSNYNIGWINVKKKNQIFLFFFFNFFVYILISCVIIK